MQRSLLIPLQAGTHRDVRLEKVGAGDQRVNHHQAAERVSCKHAITRRAVALLDLWHQLLLNEIQKVVSPPLVGLAFTVPSGLFMSQCVGVRSRVRSVLAMPTTIIGGTRLFSARKSIVLPISLMCAGPSIK